MKILNLILGILLVVMLVIFINSSLNYKETKQKFDASSNRNLNDVYDDIYKDQVLNDSGIVNKYFIDIKYHKDYSHVLSALNNLVPRVKSYFNIANIPMIIAEPKLLEVKGLISSFIDLLNDTIKKEVTSFRQSNTGWDEQLPEPKYESGWDKAQKALGLVPSLYNENFPKVSVKLIDVQNLKKYETDDEAKYVMDLIIQGITIDDQMSFKIGFTIDKRFAKNENNFNLQVVDIQNIKIEDVYINGFYSNNARDGNAFENMEEYQKYDGLNNFNDFDNFSIKNNLTDPQYIQKVLLDKYKLRTKEMNQRNSLLDEEGKDYHNSLPKLYDYQNIYATQTIFDDMNCKKIFNRDSI